VSNRRGSARPRRHGAPDGRPSAPPSHRGLLLESPAAIIFGEGRRGSGRLVLAASLATFALYGVVAVVLSRAEWGQAPRRVESPTAMQMFEHVVELPVPPPPPPPAPAPEPPKPLQAVEKTALAPAPAPRAEPAAPPPPAAAAEVVAAAPEAPLDFTGFDIATGNAHRYAGGVTASNGTNTRAVHTPAVDRNAAPDRPAGAVSLARAVQLEARDWRCPWPEQADLLSVDEERVVIRVDVDAAGSVVRAAVVEDPGYGFGDAALRCARRHRFVPALDASGRAIAATSPPIRVRFTR